jgi:cold-inducible RNA-binding protein
VVGLRDYWKRVRVRDIMNKKLYVGGLSYSTTDDSLKAAFEQAGTVESATVILDKMSGRSRGFGFVEMSTEEEATKAIEMFDGQEIDGRKVAVNESRPQKPFQERGGGGGDSGKNW